MGLEYKIVESTRKELCGATCDSCGKNINVSGPEQWNTFGEPFSYYHALTLMDDCFVLDQPWGYNSRKDGEHHHAVICESCYDKIFKDVKISTTDC
jgi:hypothetical protein